MLISLIVTGKLDKLIECSFHNDLYILSFFLGFLLGLEDESKLHAHKFDEVPLYPLKKARSSLPSNFESKDLFVIARHGKSRHYGLWPWIDLYNSNNNLFEFDPIELENVEKSGTKKCVFTEGVQKGLCSKVLFFYPS